MLLLMRPGEESTCFIALLPSTQLSSKAKLLIPIPPHGTAGSVQKVFKPLKEELLPFFLLT